MNERSWPKVGQVLVHKFHRSPGETVAKVLEVDRKAEKVVVKVETTVYPSLSAAARSVCGHRTNGWIYWGLEKYTKRR